MRIPIAVILVAFVGAGCAGMPRFDLTDVERCNIERLELTIYQYGNDKFAEKHTVQMGEFFFISDTSYRARVTHYVPHFVRSLSKGSVTSRSNEEENPGIRVELCLGEKKLYHLWFLARMPFYHRSSKPGFGFVVDKVEYGPGGAPDFTNIVIEPTPKEVERLKKGFHGTKKVEDPNKLKEEAKPESEQKQEGQDEKDNRENETDK